MSQIPFPFGSVHEFESSVRAPIGRTWNPETAFRKLTQPKKVGASRLIQTKLKRDGEVWLSVYYGEHFALQLMSEFSKWLNKSFYTLPVELRGELTVISMRDNGPV